MSSQLHLNSSSQLLGLLILLAVGFQFSWVRLASFEEQPFSQDHTSCRVTCHFFLLKASGAQSKVVLCSSPSINIDLEASGERF